MKQQLEAKGWVMYYECRKRCGNKQYYNNVQHPTYEVVVKGNTFNILMSKHVIAGPFWGYQLDEQLTKFVK